MVTAAVVFLAAYMGVSIYNSHRIRRRLDRVSDKLDEMRGGLVVIPKSQSPDRRAARTLLRWAKGIEIHRHHTPDPQEIFGRTNVFSGRETTWKDMHAQVSRQYVKYRGVLEKQWRLEGNLLKAAFFMNSAHNTIPPGNRESRKGTWSPPTGPRGEPSGYVAGNAGGCGHYADLLCRMLRIEGFEVKTVGTKDHKYVEAVIDEEPYILDPWHNFFTRGTNEDFLDQSVRSRPVYHVFPHAGSNPANEEFFRKRRGVRTMYYLLTRGRLYKRVPAQVRQVKP